MTFNIDEDVRQADWLRAKRNAGLRKGQIYSDRKLPDFSTDKGAPPVIVTDLHGTLTPDQGFPLNSKPWPRLIDTMNEYVARGVIWVVTSVSLSPEHTQPIRTARESQGWSWFTQHGMQVAMFVGSVGAAAFLDDRMVPIDVDLADPWGPAADAIAEQMERRAELGKDGIWRLKELPPVGREVQDFPDDTEIPPDAPRGYSKLPVLDFDLHRTILNANSSTQRAGLQPGAKETVNWFYDQGYTIHGSCAGWDPATNTATVSEERAAGLRMELRINGVRIDELVAKMHGTVFVNDRGVTYTTWAEAKPLVLAKAHRPLEAQHFAI